MSSHYTQRDGHYTVDGNTGQRTAVFPGYLDTLAAINAARRAGLTAPDLSIRHDLNGDTHVAELPASHPSTEDDDVEEDW